MSVLLKSVNNKLYDVDSLLNLKSEFISISVSRNILTRFMI